LNIRLAVSEQVLTSRNRGDLKILCIIDINNANISKPLVVISFTARYKREKLLPAASRAVEIVAAASVMPSRNRQASRRRIWHQKAISVDYCGWQTTVFKLQTGNLFAKELQLHELRNWYIFISFSF
jgi:hypothetical protein